MISRFINHNETSTRRPFKLIFGLAVSTLLILNSCTKDSNGGGSGEQFNGVNLTGDLEISDFVWKGLNYFYFWQESVPNLADSKAADEAAYTRFISENPEPEAFFDALKSSQDRFSWIASDYEVLENQLQGISASNGVEFGLTLLAQNDPRVIGYVRYILPGSDASNKNIKRGDFFNSVNGTELTTSNYRDLLYGDTLSYTLGLVTIEAGEPVSTGVEVALTKVENFYKDPIFIEKILELPSSKVGYLMYNQFVGTTENNEALNNVFGRFKAQNITDLILDLRYNRGGSVSNCTYLASMITGQFKDAIFSQQVWNSKLMDYWNENNEEALYDRFVDTISEGTTIKSLNLNKIYILTTSTSASASELLINGLDSHISVVHIGETTVGKNVGSITVYDYIDNNQTKNPNHKYAMQPIVLKIANSNGYADYNDGLNPDVAQDESILNMGVLGDENEPLLSTALSQISGTARMLQTTATSFPKELRMEAPEMIREQNMHTDHRMNWKGFSQWNK